VQELGGKVCLDHRHQYGLVGLAEYLRNCKHNRLELKQAGAAPKAVGLVDEGTMCELAAPTKPSPPPTWKQRQAKRMRERVRRLKLQPNTPNQALENPSAFLY
jgi:hypothetical protein